MYVAALWGLFGLWQTLIKLRHWMENWCLQQPHNDLPQAAQWPMSMIMHGRCVCVCVLWEHREKCSFVSERCKMAIIKFVHMKVTYTGRWCAFWWGNFHMHNSSRIQRVPHRIKIKKVKQEMSRSFRINLHYICCCCCCYCWCLGMWRWWRLYMHKTWRAA